MGAFHAGRPSRFSYETPPPSQGYAPVQEYLLVVFIDWLTMQQHGMTVSGADQLLQRLLMNVGINVELLKEREWSPPAFVGLVLNDPTDWSQGE